MYWFKWRCHANYAGALYRVINHNNSGEGIKCWPKLSLNRCVFSCCRKEVKDETVRMAGSMPAMQKQERHGHWEYCYAVYKYRAAHSTAAAALPWQLCLVVVTGGQLQTSGVRFQTKLNVDVAYRRQHFVAVITRVVRRQPTGRWRHWWRHGGVAEVVACENRQEKPLELQQRVSLAWTQRAERHDRML